MNEINSISCYQLNLHNAYLAQTELYSALNKQHSFCAFLQECPIPKGKFLFPRLASKFQYTKKQRAFLIISKHLDFCQINSLTTSNSMAAIGNVNGRKLLLVSIYNEPNDKSIPPWLKNILEYSNHNNLHTIIAGDINIHSQLWNSNPKKLNNKITADFEEFFVSNNVNVHNSGNVPTFRNSRDYTSHIDVMLSLNDNHETSIQKWKVHDKEVNFSDHNTITFNISKRLDDANVEFRQWDKSNWNIFNSKLEAVKIPVPVTLTQKTLDLLVDKLYDSINSALDKACPLIKK